MKLRAIRQASSLWEELLRQRERSAAELSRFGTLTDRLTRSKNIWREMFAVVLVVGGLGGWIWFSQAWSQTSRLKEAALSWGQCAALPSRSSELEACLRDWAVANFPGWPAMVRAEPSGPSQASISLGPTDVASIARGIIVRQWRDNPILRERLKVDGLDSALCRQIGRGIGLIAFMTCGRVQFTVDLTTGDVEDHAVHRSCADQNAPARVDLIPEFKSLLIGTTGGETFSEATRKFQNTYGECELDRQWLAFMVQERR